MDTESNHQFIAVVEDELELVSLFRDALSQIEGFTVFSFTDPTIALEHISINKEYYRLVLSDLRMPGLTGIELIMKVKEINTSIATVLMSSFEVEETDYFKSCWAYLEGLDKCGKKEVIRKSKKSHEFAKLKCQWEQPTRCQLIIALLIFLVRVIAPIICNRLVYLKYFCYFRAIKSVTALNINNTVTNYPIRGLFYN